MAKNTGRGSTNEHFVGTTMWNRTSNSSGRFVEAKSRGGSFGKEATMLKKILLLKALWEAFQGLKKRR